MIAAYGGALRSLSLEHCPGVGEEGVARLAARLPALREVRVFGTGVDAAAAVRIAAGLPPGRRLRVVTQKRCWWR